MENSRGAEGCGWADGWGSKTIFLLSLRRVYTIVLCVTFILLPLMAYLSSVPVCLWSFCSQYWAYFTWTYLSIYLSIYLHIIFYFTHLLIVVHVHPSYKLSNVVSLIKFAFNGYSSGVASGQKKWTAIRRQKWKWYFCLHLGTTLCPIKVLILPICTHLLILCHLLAAVAYCLWNLGWLPADASHHVTFFVGWTVSSWQRLGLVKQRGEQNFLEVCTCSLWTMLWSLNG